MSKQTVKLKSAAHLRALRRILATHGDGAEAVSHAIWNYAEPPMEEYKSADCLEEYLSSNGFKVTRPWKTAPTAFRAVAGAGRPRVAFMAEYDALPDCGPKPGQWGHGCGHNLLGSASALGGVVAAETLKQIGAAGQIVVIGTPAEEILSGKVILAEAGAFKGLDAVIAWHPGGKTVVLSQGGQAMDSLAFKFYGKTSHAAAVPQDGRSALDAAILTDVAVNYLREHVEENVRIHSVIPNGGSAPNVVPDRAELWYYVRGRDRAQVDELTRRVTLCARGAAMATETRVRTLFYDSLTERIPNTAISETLDAVVHRCGGVKFSPADQKAAEKILPGKKYSSRVEPMQNKLGRASSDENNVSWFAPMGRFNAATGPLGGPAHHRLNAQIARLSGAQRGMKKAAEIMAMGAVELILNKPLLSKVKAEFTERMKGRKYRLPPRCGKRPGQ